MISKIHQIWIGDTIPEDILKYTNKMKEMNPEYEYKLWTNKDLVEFGLVELFEQSEYTIKMTKTYIANIMRFKILTKYGGWHIDADVEPLSPLSKLKIDTEMACSAFEHQQFYIFEAGSCIYSEKFDFTEMLEDYVPIRPIMRLFNQYVLKNNVRMTEISKELVGPKGTVLIDRELHSWRKPKKSGENNE